MMPKKSTSLAKKIKYNDSEFVLRIKVKSITEYDSNGKILHTKTLKNSYSDEIEEEWYKYDEKGNEIWHGTSWGQEWWNDYNSLNWNTHGKNSDGLEWDNTFDSKGKLIRTKYTDGTEEKYFYDVKENLIKEQRNYGYEMEIKYLLNMLPMENMGMTKMSIHANMMKEVIKFTKSPPAIEVHIIQQAKNFGNLIATETKSHIQLEKVQFLLKCMIMILEKMEK